LVRDHVKYIYVLNIGPLRSRWQVLGVFALAL
jgi:hypothetical protein